MPSSVTDAPAGSPQRTALAFLKAYWAADLETALTHCVAGATIELPPSVPIKTPAPIAEVLPQIFADVYPRFVGGRFDVRIERTISERTAVVVEYVASGSLVNGRTFRCGYVVVLDIADSKVQRFRSYTDTRHIADELLS
jgi:hypothetical protein